MAGQRQRMGDQTRVLEALVHRTQVVLRPAEAVDQEHAIRRARCVVPAGAAAASPQQLSRSWTGLARAMPKPGRRNADEPDDAMQFAIVVDDGARFVAGRERCAVLSRDQIGNRVLRAAPLRALVEAGGDALAIIRINSASQSASVAIRAGAVPSSCAVSPVTTMRPLAGSHSYAIRRWAPMAASKRVCHSRALRAAMRWLAASTAIRCRSALSPRCRPALPARGRPGSPGCRRTGPCPPSCR